MLRMRGVQPPSSDHCSAGRRGESAEVEVVRRMERGIEKRSVSGCTGEARRVNEHSRRTAAVLRTSMSARATPPRPAPSNCLRPTEGWTVPPDCLNQSRKAVSSGVKLAIGCEECGKREKREGENHSTSSSRVVPLLCLRESPESFQTTVHICTSYVLKWERGVNASRERFSFSFLQESSLSPVQQEFGD